MNYLFQPQRYNFTAVLLDGYRHTVGWLPPHCWMATATLLDGNRHTLWLTCQKQKMLLTTIVTLPC